MAPGSVSSHAASVMAFGPPRLGHQRGLGNLRLVKNDASSLGAKAWRPPTVVTPLARGRATWGQPHFEGTPGKVAAGA